MLLSLWWRKEVSEVVLARVSVVMEETTKRELGYLKVRCGVAKMDWEEGREKLMEVRVRRVGNVRGTEIVAAMAIAALSSGGG